MRGLIVNEAALAAYEEAFRIAWESDEFIEDCLAAGERAYVVAMVRGINAAVPPRRSEGAPEPRLSLGRI